MNPGLIEALGQLLTGLKHIGDSVTYLVGFLLNALGLSVSQELIKIASILILLSVVWKLGSKLTSSIFWFFIIAQVMSFVSPA
ncbi:MAG: hypothetical protein JSW14_05510 [Candidatus Bathyarchaeum sp.]|nr:MAG: hypothetical protein JSW14_05510 [Candidatus Bathyarchaeum sp.]